MAFGAGCLARSRYERDCLVTEEYRIASEKIHGQGKTIVFLTDLHNKEFGEENSRLLETVRKVKPDAVLFGGDGMVAKRGNSDVRIPLALLTELAKEFPVYCGNGNLRFTVRLMRIIGQPWKMQGSVISPTRRRISTAISGSMASIFQRAPICRGRERSLRVF